MLRHVNRKSWYLGVISKLGELHVIQQAAGRLDDVLTLLRGLLHLPGQEEAAATRHLKSRRQEG